MNKFRILIVAEIAALCSPAFAQTEATPPEGATALQEIVVTAQKRVQSENDVGLSITAVDASTLSRRDISDVSDLVKIVPGLSVADAGNGATVVYTLRGIGFNSSNLGATSAVAVYVDEIALPYPIMTQGAGLDLHTVEVYYGPQGTLFGQNSTGGAVNYIANKPTNHFSAGAEASYGRFNWWDVKAFVSGPISDTLKARIAVSQDGGDGWQQSYTRDASLGRPDHTKVRLLLAWDPSSAIRVNGGINAWRDASQSEALQLVKYTPLSPPGLAKVVAFPTAPQNARAADWDSGKDFQYDSNFLQPFVRADFDLAAGLTLTSVSTYSDFYTNSLIDPDGTPYEIGEIHQTGDIHDFNQELRLSGNSDRLNWVAGANYQRNVINEKLGILIHDLSNVQNIGGSGFGAILSPITSTQSTNARAIFGNTEFHFTDTLSAVAGARFTRTSIKFTGCNLDSGPPIANEPIPGVTASLRGFFNLLYGQLTGNVGADPIQQGGCITLDNISRNGQPVTFLPTDSPQTLDEHNTSWNVTLDYKPIPTALLYGRIAQGYKSGSFPTIGATTSTQFLPAKQEGLLSYELGYKLTLLDRHLQLDGAAFYYDYKNKQLSNFVPDPIFGPLVAIVNVPKSRVFGSEIAASVIPLEGLDITASVTYIDTKITNFNGFDLNGNPADLAGQRFNLAPAWTGNLDAIYSFTIKQGLTGFLGAGVTSRSATSGVIGSTDPDYNIKAYSTVDAQVGVNTASGWMIQLWGKNVLNEYYWTNVNRVSDTIVRPAAMPATYGITVEYKF
jgi:iron complex outermembrane receptor protein